MGLLERILDEFEQAGEPKNRPLVTLSYAQSIDGSIAARRGRPLLISGDQSAVLTHQLRANHDGILVGVGTVIADDPRLTVRLANGADPQPVIMDSSLRTPTNSFLVKSRNPWIAITNGAGPKKAEQFASLAVTLMHLPSEEGDRVNLQAMIEGLHQMGMRRLMVEGGGEVISSFIASQLVDFMIITISPLIVGGFSAFQNPLAASRNKSSEFPRLDVLMSENFGEDLVIFGRVMWPDKKGDQGEK